MGKARNLSVLLAADGQVEDAKIDGVAASKLTGALPAISGASLTNVVAVSGVATDATKLPLAGGAMTGAITTNSTFDTRDVATDGTKLDTIETNADVTDTANVTSAGALMDSELAGLAAVKATTGTFLTADQTKLDNIETAATADQTNEEIQDIVGGMLTSNTESGITVTYQDADGTIDFNVPTQSENDFTTVLKNKLDAIEASATADQTGAQIKTAYQAETNAFTDAQFTKLAAIEASATADQTNAEIRTAVEAASNSNVFTDADHSKLNAIEAAADVTDTANVVSALSAGTGVSISGAGVVAVTAVALTTVQTASSQSAHLALTAQEGDIVVRSDENKTYCHNGGSAGNMNDYTLLATPTDAVLSVNGVTGAVTAAHIATAVEAASNSNTFTDADHTKLNAIEASATADQTNAEIRTAVEAASDSNVFTDADHSKLNAVAASANAYVHPNHSGEVTSSADGATVIASNVVDEANLKVSNNPTNGYFLSAQSGNTGGMTWAEVDALPSQSGNAGKYLTTDATNASWAVLDTDANTTTKGLYEHAHTITSNYSMTSGNNALTAGPITINSGVSVTIPSGSTWIIA